MATGASIVFAYKCLSINVGSSVAYVFFLGTKSRHLFQKYIKELDHILISPIYIKVSLMLYSKRCINEATLDKIETDHRSPDDKKPLLTAMQEAVHNDYGKLKDIANVLAKFNETRKIADQLKTKYGNQ